MTFHIRQATTDDYPRIAQIINSQEVEGTSVEEMLRGDRLRPANMPFWRLVAIDGQDVLVAFGTVFRDDGMPQGCFGLRVRVDREYRHLGAGAALYRELEAWAVAQGATRLETSVKEDRPDAMAWAERRGWAKEHHLFESTLELKDWAPSAELLDTVSQAEAAGIRFTCLADEVEGEELLRRHYDFLSAMMRDVPVFGERPMPPFENWKTYVQGDPDYNPRNVRIAVDGEKWVALCELNAMPSGGLYHGLTAVDREYRGRGLSTAIKIVALTYAREKGVPYVRTNNHSSNQRMLAVNRKFGYVPAPGFYTIAKTNLS